MSDHLAALVAAARCPCPASCGAAHGASDGEAAAAALRALREPAGPAAAAAVAAAWPALWCASANLACRMLACAAPRAGDARARACLACAARAAAAWRPALAALLGPAPAGAAPPPAPMQARALCALVRGAARAPLQLQGVLWLGVAAAAPAAAQPVDAMLQALVEELLEVLGGAEAPLLRAIRGMLRAVPAAQAQAPRARARLPSRSAVAVVAVADAAGMLRAASAMAATKPGSASAIQFGALVRGLAARLLDGSGVAAALGLAAPCDGDDGGVELAEVGDVASAAGMLQSVRVALAPDVRLACILPLLLASAEYLLLADRQSGAAAASATTALRLLTAHEALQSIAVTAAADGLELSALLAPTPAAAGAHAAAAILPASALLDYTAGDLRRLRAALGLKPLSPPLPAPLRERGLCSVPPDARRFIRASACLGGADISASSGDDDSDGGGGRAGSQSRTGATTTSDGMRSWLLHCLQGPAVRACACAAAPAGGPPDGAVSCACATQPLRGHRALAVWGHLLVIASSRAAGDRRSDGDAAGSAAADGPIFLGLPQAEPPLPAALHLRGGDALLAVAFHDLLPSPRAPLAPLAARLLCRFAQAALDAGAAPAAAAGAAQLASACAMMLERLLAPTTAVPAAAAPPRSFAAPASLAEAAAWLLTWTAPFRKYAQAAALTPLQADDDGAPAASSAAAAAPAASTRLASQLLLSLLCNRVAAACGSRGAAAATALPAPPRLPPWVAAAAVPSLRSYAWALSLCDLLHRALRTRVPLSVAAHAVAAIARLAAIAGDDSAAGVGSLPGTSDALAAAVAAAAAEEAGGGVTGGDHSSAWQWCANASAVLAAWPTRQDEVMTPLAALAPWLLAAPAPPAAAARPPLPSSSAVAPPPSPASRPPPATPFFMQLVRRTGQPATARADRLPESSSVAPVMAPTALAPAQASVLQQPLPPVLVDESAPAPILLADPQCLCAVALRDVLSCYAIPSPSLARSIMEQSLRLAAWPLRLCLALDALLPWLPAPVGPVAPAAHPPWSPYLTRTSAGAPCGARLVLALPEVFREGGGGRLPATPILAPLKLDARLAAAVAPACVAALVDLCHAVCADGARLPVQACAATLAVLLDRLIITDAAPASPPPAAALVAPAAVASLAGHWLRVCARLVQLQAGAGAGAAGSLALALREAGVTVLVPRLLARLSDELLTGEAAAAPASSAGCATCGAHHAGAAAAAFHAACVAALARVHGGDGCSSDEVELADARMQLQAVVRALTPALPRPPPAPHAPLPPSQMALATAGSASSAPVAGAKRMRGGGVDAAAAAARPGAAAPRRGPPGAGAGAAVAAAAIFSRHPVINRWAREDAQQGSDGGRRKGKRAAAVGDDWADLEDFLVVG